MHACMQMDRVLLRFCSDIQISLRATRKLVGDRAAQSRARNMEFKHLALSQLALEYWVKPIIRVRTPEGP